MTFFESIAGFLFHPYDQCKKVLSEEKSTKNFTQSLLLVIYSAFIIGIVLCFWALYPERIYYGVPLDAELKMLFRICYLYDDYRGRIFFGIHLEFHDFWNDQLLY